MDGIWELFCFCEYCCPRWGPAYTINPLNAKLGLLSRCPWVPLLLKVVWLGTGGGLQSTGHISHQSDNDDYETVLMLIRIFLQFLFEKFVQDMKPSPVYLSLRDLILSLKKVYLLLFFGLFLGTPIPACHHDLLFGSFKIFS